ncbi:MAG: SET domain-containing protein-lysine N-methyltransferase [Planctomycetes bacterium]|nr:SET domain-containing protein-lysine N-methyltransferase [Planctomycetota bacterium]
MRRICVENQARDDHRPVTGPTLPLTPGGSRTPRLAVAQVGARGRGVVATTAFAQGELLESCPVLVLPAEQWPLLESTDLFGYLFAFGERMEHAAIALGLGSLYNHSYAPCATYVKDWNAGMIHFYALRAITPGEEITVNYNNGRAEDRTPLWFDVLEE